MFLPHRGQHATLLNTSACSSTQLQPEQKAATYLFWGISPADCELSANWYTGCVQDISFELGRFPSCQMQVSPFFSLLQDCWLSEAMGLTNKLVASWVEASPMGEVKVLQFSSSGQALSLCTYLNSYLIPGTQISVTNIFVIQIRVVCRNLEFWGFFKICNMKMKNEAYILQDKYIYEFTISSHISIVTIKHSCCEHFLLPCSILQ